LEAVSRIRAYPRAFQEIIVALAEEISLAYGGVGERRIEGVGRGRKNQNGSKN